MDQLYGRIEAFLREIPSGGTVQTSHSGERAAQAALQDFVCNHLETYTSGNKKEADGLWMLRPHLRYGHISPVQVIAAAQKALIEKPGLRAGYAKLWREIRGLMVRRA